MNFLRSPPFSFFSLASPLHFFIFICCLVSFFSGAGFCASEAANAQVDVMNAKRTAKTIFLMISPREWTSFSIVGET